MRRLRGLVISGAVLLALVAGCDSGSAGPEASDGAEGPQQTAGVGHAVGGAGEDAGADDAGGDDAGVSAFAVDQLGIAFELTDGYQTYPSDLSFSARDAALSSIFTVDPFAPEPDLAGWVPRPGEEVSELQVDGVAVLEVRNSGMDLPPGVEANLLLVANGDRSFSLIMSAPQEALADQWGVFMDSLDITAAS